MKTVFLFLSTRIYISDALHTPYIDELAKKYRVLVFLPVLKGSKNKIDTSKYYQHKNVSYHTLPDPRGKFWTLFDVLLRNEFVRRHDHTIPIQWRDKWKRKADKRRVFLHNIARLFPRKFFSVEFFSFLEKHFMPDFALFKTYAKKYKPHLVLVSTPGFIPFDAYAIGCAHKMKIPTVAFNFSWDNLTSYPRHIRKTKYLVCWNNFLKEKAFNLHNYAKGNVFVGGVIRFDHYLRTLKGETAREEFLKSHRLDPNRKTVLYAARSHGTYFKEFIQTLIKWQKEDAFVEPINLFIRVHPLDTLDDYKEFANVPNVIVSLSGSPQSNTVSGRNNIETEAKDWVIKKDTIRHCDICLNLVSTFTLEAFIFNKPVINFGFVDHYSGILKFPHYAPLVEVGASRVAETIDDTKKYINMYLKDPSRDTAERAMIVKRFVEPTDGYSYKRNVGFLEEILEKEYAKK